MASDTAERLLYLLKSRGPLSAAQAGKTLGMTAAGAQQHFAKLAEAGLVDHQDRKHGRGRPHRFWRLTGKGHARFPDRHSDLTVSLLEWTEKLFGAEGLEKIIRQREQETLKSYAAALATCASLADRVRTLARIRSEEGYMAECKTLADDGFLLIENHCPICAAAAACQGLCRSELDVFRAVLGPAARVERTDYLLAGARRCAYEIRPAA